MIATKTVLVLGAGASAPYGLPTGGELVRRIRKFALSVEAGNWWGAFREYIEINKPQQLSRWQHLDAKMKDLGRQLQTARPYSIDEFLERRPDITDVGKLVLAIQLLQAERKSGGQLQSDADGDHWYDFVKSRLVGSAERLEQNRIRVITFNYERSLEHYLFESLRPYYANDLTDDDYRNMMNGMPVVHIYGSLGFLPWQSDTAVVAFGAQGYGEILTATETIKILHEGTRDDVQGNLERAKEWLNWADRVVFLGFGFHEDNVERLGLGTTLRKNQQIYGTCHGLDHTRKSKVEYCTQWAVRPDQARGGVPPRCAIRFPDKKEAKCYEFLHGYVDLS